MKLNNIDCCKPKRKQTSFTRKPKQNNNKEVLCKHFYQMDNDTLELVSVARAYKQVQNSNKMKFFKALPSIGRALFLTAFMAAQPNKLSSKVASGIGLLAVSESAVGISKGLFKTIDKNKNNDSTEQQSAKKGLALFGSVIASTLTIGAGIKYGTKALNAISPKAADFVKNDISKLANELNQSKLGKFVEEKFNPAVSNKVANAALWTLPFVSSIATSLVGAKTAKSISKDFKNNAEVNYNKAKEIISQARKEYDSVQAPEF